MPAALVNAPQYPPMSWAREPIAGWSGGSVKIITDGPERGRACGLVQPPPGSARYIGAGIHHGRGIPATYPDETFRDFHCGAWYFDDGGDLVSVPVGSIAIGGGHSNAVRASTVGDARDYLQRRGAHAAEDQLAVYGTVRRLTDGPHAGGLLFCGAAYPHLTMADAMVFNTTTLSGENWPHPDHGGRLQFIGPARVQRTSFAYDLPIAADADGDDGPLLVCFIDDDGNQVCEACDEPVLAEVADADFAEVRRIVDDLVERMDRHEAAIADLELATTSGDDITIVGQVDAIIERMVKLETEAAQRERNQSVGQDDSQLVSKQATPDAPRL